jgi:hypothetical protein
MHHTKLVVQLVVLFLIAFSIYTPFNTNHNLYVNVAIFATICIVGYIDTSVAILLTCLWLVNLSKQGKFDSPLTAFSPSSLAKQNT